MQTSLYFQQNTRWSHLNKPLAPLICSLLLFALLSLLFITAYVKQLMRGRRGVSEGRGGVAVAKMSTASRWLFT